MVLLKRKRKDPLFKDVTHLTITSPRSPNTGDLLSPDLDMTKNGSRCIL